MKLSKEMQSDISNVLLATIKAQSMIHTLDNITNENNTFKQAKKREWNEFIAYVKRFADKQGIDLFDFTSDIDGHVQNYLDCVQKFDDLGETFNLRIEV